MYRILMLLILVILFNSCHQNDIRYYQKIVNDSKTNIDSVKTLVIIPGIGCLGCITGAESFLKSHNNKLKNIKFILTNIQSIKTLRLKLGHAIDSPSIYLDNENLWYNPESENSIYPIVISLKDKKILKLEYISPNNPHNIPTILRNWELSQ